MSTPDFREIGLCGGIASISVVESQGRRGYSIGYQTSRPVKTGLWAVWVIPPGIPVDYCSIGGIGDTPPLRPFPNAFQVHMPSDNQGRFGRQCQICNGYWRDGGIGSIAICPYCGVQQHTHETITEGQLRYIHAFTEKFIEAINSDIGTTLRLNLDEVATTVDTPDKRPAFYFAEESQQFKYDCQECGTFNDILGKTGYCAACGTRNDLKAFRDIRIAETRRRIHSAESDQAGCLRDMVSAFDSTIKALANQLIARVPLLPSRRASLECFGHSLTPIRNSLDVVFGIDLFSGLSNEEINFSTKMFHRRHVHEHKNGIIDAIYLDSTNDVDVRLGQALAETAIDMQKLSELVVRMVQNMHEGFHKIFEPRKEPIEWERAKKARIRSASANQNR
jgi:hypothetical protein